MPALPPDPANLAALAKSQSLATLLAALKGDAGLKGGQTVEAQLLALDGEGKATALVNGVKISLILAGPEAKQAALQPGTALMLRLAAPEQPGAPLQATLLGTRPPPAGDAAPASPIPRAPAPLPGQAPATPPAPAGQPANPALAASPRAVAGPLLSPALARQDSLAPLFANLGGLAQGSVALMLPKPLLSLIDQILAQRLPAAGRPVTAEALKSAVLRSGVFLEARQAAGEAPTPRTDLKAGLQLLRDLLRPAIQSTLTGQLASLEPDAAAPPPPSAARAAAAPPGETSQPQAPARPAPLRDGVLTPQPAAEPSLTAASRPALIAQTLFEQADAALDRIALSQYASLPPEPARGEQQQPARWLTEIPLAFQQGTAVMPLEIERDPPQPGSASPDAPVWRVRFALDVEPLGALQGVITLQGRALGVSFWAEREETSRLLRQSTADLETSLLQSRFDSADFEVFTGQPRRPPAAAGQFLDRRT
jgi:hypothetical protein